MPVDPLQALATALQRASASANAPLVRNAAIGRLIEVLCRTESNRACIRLVLACAVARIHRPRVDVTKPYTEIPGNDTFSGRKYDEQYVGPFAEKNHLPVNSTTAFLTPAFRNINKPLTSDVEIVGRPREVYRATLKLLEAIKAASVSAEDVLAEAIRLLILVREERAQRMKTLLAGLARPQGSIVLSSEQIINLLSQHLQSRNASRLPVLIVAAMYNSVEDKLGERALALHGHNAADLQTGALGDVEVCLVSDEAVVTAFEMKAKIVSIEDINIALHKIARAAERGDRIDNYIFITTDMIDEEVARYARAAYEQTGGTEIAILNCLAFARHFLHFFHRSRIRFLDEYQKLVLSEPDSAVGQPLKELLLTLRRAAQADIG